MNSYKIRRIKGNKRGAWEYEKKKRGKKKDDFSFINSRLHMDNNKCREYDKQ